MGRIYNIQAANITVVTAVNVLVGIYPVATPPAAGSVLAINRVEITQNANTTSAQVRAVLSARTGGNLTVATITPSAAMYGGSASAIAGVAGTLAAGKCGITGSADATPTYVDLVAASFNALNGWLWIPTPSERIFMTGAVAFVVRFLADPGTLTGWNCTVNYEEIY
jgi:hypothetical protein